MPTHGLNVVCEDERVGNSDRLSGLDASFLHMEREGAHMHVASTIIFEGPAPTTPPQTGLRAMTGISSSVISVSIPASGCPS